MSADQKVQNQTTALARTQPPDVVTDEDIALRKEAGILRKKVALLEGVLVESWSHRDVAKSLTDILDPLRMTEEEQNACLLLIRYCRQRVSEKTNEGKSA